MDDPDTDIQYVVIAGVDSVIPFYRVQDRVAISNESDYMVGAESDGNNPQYYALEGGFWTDTVTENGTTVTITNHYGFISTDDIYTDDNPLGFQGHELFVPDRASGRLVETPEEMMATIANFLQVNENDETIGGSVVVNNTLVTAYDFLTDSGLKINDALGSLGVTNQSTLLTENWSAGQLASSWPNASTKPRLKPSRITCGQLN